MFFFRLIIITQLQHTETFQSIKLKEIKEKHTVLFREKNSPSALNI